MLKDFDPISVNTLLGKQRVSFICDQVAGRILIGCPTNRGLFLWSAWSMAPGKKEERGVGLRRARSNSHLEGEPK